MVDAHDGISFFDPVAIKTIKLSAFIPVGIIPFIFFIQKLESYPFLFHFSVKAEKIRQGF